MSGSKAEPRDLLAIASGVGEAEILARAAYRALGNAYEDETDPIEVAAAVRRVLRAARDRLDAAITDLRNHRLGGRAMRPNTAADCIAHIRDQISTADHKAACTLIELYAATKPVDAAARLHRLRADAAVGVAVAREEYAQAEAAIRADRQSEESP